MLDDDKRQLRLYQERYLADGDLHSDGPGRMRKFRWKNIGILIVAFRSKLYKGTCLSSLRQQEEIKTIAGSCGGPCLDLYFLLMDRKSLCRCIVNEKGSLCLLRHPLLWGVQNANSLNSALDDASQMDLFHRDSDDDQTEEQLDETEARWRKERIEREQWLRDQVGSLQEILLF